MTTERAPAYAGHQAHPCPVCLNVHGGEGLTVESLDYALQTTRWWERGRLGANGLSSRQLAEEVLAALTERSATPQEALRCEHRTSDGQCIVVGPHQRAAGLVHVYESRPIVIGEGP